MEVEEEARISQVYKRRGMRRSNFFVFDDYAHCYRVHQRYVATLRLLHQIGMRDLAPLKILDVGCGEGSMLRETLQWGASPENLAGIDLLEGQIVRALHLNPNIDYRYGSATKLPWADNTFDLVILHTVYTSMLDGELKQLVSQEITRVLKPAGMILWYDFTFNNPQNPDVKGVGRAEIAHLFPDYTCQLAKFTLAPPIARRLPSFIFGLSYQFLSLFPVLRTHLLGLIIKRT